MAVYEIRIKEAAEKELLHLPKEDLKRATEKMHRLADNPRPPGSEKLKGDEGYRIRQGDYRIVYTVDEGTRIVRIIRIGHRREVYR